MNERHKTLRGKALQGGTRYLPKLREQHKLTARERLDLLLDPGSFVETDALTRHRVGTFGLDQTRPPTDGVVTGWGTVNGRKVFVYSQDFTVFGGSLGEMQARRSARSRTSP